MKVKSESEVTQLCPTLIDLMDCSPPCSSIHGLFQARVLEWGAIAFFVCVCVYIYFVNRAIFQGVYVGLGEAVDRDTGQLGLEMLIKML